MDMNEFKKFEHWFFKVDKLKDNSGKTYLACFEERPSGFGILLYYDSITRPIGSVIAHEVSNQHLRLVEIFIYQVDYCNMGLGTQLLQSTIAEARERKYKYIIGEIIQYSDKPNLKTWFANNGFEVHGKNIRLNL